MPCKRGAHNARSCFFSQGHRSELKQALHLCRKGRIVIGPSETASLINHEPANSTSAASVFAQTPCDHLREEVQYRSVDVAVTATEERVLNSLSNAENSSPSPRTLRTVQKSLKIVKEMGPAQAIWTVLPLHHHHNGTTLQGRIQLTSRKINRTFRHCSKAVVFAMTLGPEIDQLIEETQSKNVSRGVVLDRAASIAAEQTVEAFHKKVKQCCGPDMATTHRYSPGYCDWPIDDQKRIASVLPLEKCGIRVGSTSLLQPRKSVTGIIGIGPRGVVTQNGNACKLCGHRYCSFRRKGNI